MIQKRSNYYTRKGGYVGKGMCVFAKLLPFVYSGSMHNLVIAGYVPGGQPRKTSIKNMFLLFLGKLFSSCVSENLKIMGHPRSF